MDRNDHVTPAAERAKLIQGWYLSEHFLKRRLTQACPIGSLRLDSIINANSPFLVLDVLHISVVNADSLCGFTAPLVVGDH